MKSLRRSFFLGKKPAFGLPIISVLIALVLWVVVFGSRNADIVKEVPLRVIPPGDLALVTELPEFVSFRLSGPKAFLRGILDRNEAPIVINLTHTEEVNSTYRFFAGNIDLPIGVKVQGIFPSQIAIKMEAAKRKEVPIKLSFEGTVKEGLVFLGATALPTMVTVRGAESVLSRVSTVDVEPVRLSRIEETKEVELKLLPREHLIQLPEQTFRALIRVAPVRRRNLERSGK